MMPSIQLKMMPISNAKGQWAKGHLGQLCRDASEARAALCGSFLKHSDL